MIIRNLINWGFVISSHLVSSGSAFPQEFPIKMLYKFVLPMSAICPANLKILDTPNNNIYSFNITSVITNALMHSQTNENRSCQRNTLNSTASSYLISITMESVCQAASSFWHKSQGRTERQADRYEIHTACFMRFICKQPHYCFISKYCDISAESLNSLLRRDVRY